MEQPDLKYAQPIWSQILRCRCLCGATRQAWESGLAAIQRVDELQQTLALLGVPAHVGPVEERCYQLQLLLEQDEQQR